MTRYAIRRVSDGQWWCGIPDDGKQGVWSRFPEDARAFALSNDATVAVMTKGMGLAQHMPNLKVVPLTRGAQTGAVA